ncbi:hypothetical protein [Arabidopsis thaliana]|uniref:Uncharacterized protein AT4g38490 n=1 Tax=Arabidopsis thaliana TaxID=3702 RepID=Q9SZM9_ARATH|nr:hypothetical protein [Arabidopsis thaliana]CAB80513.1 hypothetical protein [Arabidopsis thaliana]
MGSDPFASSFLGICINGRVSHKHVRGSGTVGSVGSARESWSSHKKLPEEEPLWLSLLRDMVWSTRSLLSFMAEQPSQLKYIEWPTFASTVCLVVVVTTYEKERDSLWSQKSIQNQKSEREKRVTSGEVGRKIWEVLSLKNLLEACFFLKLNRDATTISASINSLSISLSLSGKKNLINSDEENDDDEGFFLIRCPLKNQTGPVR